MSAVLQHDYGNPTSTHAEGAKARAKTESAREQVAHCIGAAPEEVYFTAGASEANNMLLASLMEPTSKIRHLITSRVEHPSVAEPASRLERLGLRVTWIPVDTQGRVDPEAVLSAADTGADLVSLIWANNETGVIQPIESLAQGLADRGIPLHVDATQAVGKWTVNASKTPISYLSCSAHKLNGPKGTGCLWVRRQQSIAPLVLGGPQERKLRGGTENVAGIVGFGLACELARNELELRMETYRSLRDRLWAEISKRIPSVRRNGSVSHILPNTLNLEIPGAAGEVMVQALDLEGIAISMGAACHSGSISPSHVLTAMGLEPEQARSSLRLSVGYGLSMDDMVRAAEVLAEVAQRARWEVSA